MLTTLSRIVRSCYLGLFILALAVQQLHAQTRIPESKLTIDVTGTSLTQLLEIIQKKSGISFSYNPNKIPSDRKIDYKVVNKTLPLILNDLVDQFGIRYMLVESQIIIKTEKKPEKEKEKERKVIAPLTYSGNIKDKLSGEALIGATITIKELKTGSVTNAFGFFSLTVPKGQYEVICSFIGYKSYTTTIDLNYPIKENIMMEEEPPLLNEVVVIGELHDVTKEIQASITNLRPKVIEERPALLGEMDVVKTLESVPGIKLHSDGSTFYYVRGGNRDQNLLLLDDAPIYNPSHMLGVFSTIIPDAVNDVNIYKGNMPASLGGRLSSVLEVRTKKGNDQHFQFWGSTGLVSTKAGVEGPIKKNKSSFLVSARASNIGWLFKLSDKNIKQFNFLDLTGKLNFKLNSNNQLFFSSYTGSDNYMNNTNGLAWSNTAGTLRWNHLFTDKLFSNTTLAGGNYDYSLYTDVATKTRWNSHIGNLNLKSDFSYFIRPENELTFGWSINGYNFNPGNLKSSVELPSVPTLSVKNSIEFILYANHETKISEKIGVNYGLRVSSWKDDGEAFEFKYDENKKPIDTTYYKKGVGYGKYIKAEPRLTINYSLSDNSSVKASYARNVQNVHLISNSVSPFTSLEVWLPSSDNIKPQIADQYTLGYYRTFSDKRTSFTAEGYYKNMYNQIDYVPHAETLLNPLIDAELLFGKAISYGLELTARKDEGRMHGLAGYTYSRAKRKFDGINNGKTYNAFYDRPHQVNLMVTYDLSLRWNVGMNWNYSTGAPYTAPISFYYYNGEEVPVYGGKNNARLPDYHRMDLSATFKLNKNPEKRFKHSISFSIFNIYGRKNALFVNYNKTDQSDGSFKIPTDLLSADRQTSQFYLFRFTPSFSYNFKFL